MSLALYVSTASSCDARYFSNCCVCFIVSSVGFDDCDAIALMGHNNVLSTALPRNKNFPHTCCMYFFPALSSGGADDSLVAYCFFAPYCMGTLG